MSGQPPTPDGVRTVPEFVMRLRSLQAWAGLSYRQIHRRVVRLRQVRGIPEHPSLDTVYRCLQPGRRRLDPELVVDIARVLLGDEAVAAHQLALAIGQEIGYRECEMDALNGLGLALGQQGRLDDAVEQHAAALTLSEQSGSRWQQAHAHDGLAQARLAGGDRAAARRHWRRAQTLHTAMGTPDAERIAACLKGLDRAG